MIENFLGQTGWWVDVTLMRDDDNNDKAIDFRLMISKRVWVEKVIWWKHNCKSGQYSSAKVHKTLSVNNDGSYTLLNLDGLNPEEIDGF